MMTNIDKALAGLIVTLIATYTPFTGESTVLEVVEWGVAWLGQGALGGALVWAVPNKPKKGEAK